MKIFILNERKLPVIRNLHMDNEGGNCHKGRPTAGKRKRSSKQFLPHATFFDT